MSEPTSREDTTSHPGGAYRAGGASTPPPPPTSHRRMRAMAIVRWLLLLAVTSLAAYSVWTFWGPPSHEHRGARPDRYYCAMHPQIRSPDPGECPICHMTLVPIPVERQQPASAITQAQSEVPTQPPSVMGGDAGAIGHEDAGALPNVVPVTLALDRQQLVGVTTAPVLRRDLGQQLRVPGVIAAPENAIAQVHVRAPGYVERVAVRETGVRVTRGQPLAWVYSPQIYQAQQELLIARGWATAGPPGADTAHPAAQGRDALASSARSAEVESAARRALELLGVDASDIDAVIRAGVPMRSVPLRAPAAGYITRFAGVLGAYATPEMTLYEIADLSRVWIVASVYERDLPRVRAGAVARFTTPARPGEPTSARVVLVEPDISESTRTARVRLDAPNPNMAFRPGQYGDVTFDLPGSTALVVPRDAVIDTGRQQYAYVDRGGGRFEPRSIRVGALIGDLFEVTGGLREGERVVVRGNFMIDSESRLQASLSAVPAATPDAGVNP